MKIYREGSSGGVSGGVGVSWGNSKIFLRVAAFGTPAPASDRFLTNLHESGLRTNWY